MTTGFRLAPRSVLALLVLIVCARLARAQQPAQKSQTPAANAVTSGNQPPSAATSTSQPLKPEARVVISVGETKITASDVDGIIQALPPQYRAYYTGAGKQLLPQYLIQLKVLSAEARKQNLQDQPNVQRAIEIARESILADAARRKIEESIPVTDGELRGLYEKQKPNLEEVRIRDILIRTDKAAINPATAPPRPALAEAEARKKLEDLRKQILAGGDFAQFAQANSEDLATAGNGGDMGYVNHQTVVPPIAQAAYALKPGQVSDIIPTPYGFEIIKVEDKRYKPFDELKTTLQAQARGQRAGKAVEKIEQEYHPVVDYQYFSAPQIKVERDLPPKK